MKENSKLVPTFVCRVKIEDDIQVSVISSKKGGCEVFLEATRERHAEIRKAHGNYIESLARAIVAVKVKQGKLNENLDSDKIILTDYEMTLLSQGFSIGRMKRTLKSVMS